MANVDNDHERMNSDFIIADGNVQTQQGYMGTVIGKGSRQYPHEPHDYEHPPSMDWDNWRATRMNPDAPPRWRDDNGVPWRLCSIGSHYSPVAAFDPDAAKESGLATNCRQCLRDQVDKDARDKTRLDAEMRAEEAQRKRRSRLQRGLNKART